MPMRAGLRQRLAWALPALLAMAVALVTAPAHAHMMSAQQGTLNLVGTGGFMVMSVPVAALQGVDDDGDSRLSLTELRAHASAVKDQVSDGIQLLGESGPLALEALMLNLVPDERAPTAPAPLLVVMGRFAITDPSREAVSQLKLRFTLFGDTPELQQQTITVHRGNEAQKIVLSPSRSTAALLPSPWSVLKDNATLGADHVLGGLDHMLFLLVVLASGWGWRRTALALTVFTMGHAISLGAVVIGGFSAPASIVEPAIAATIIGMAVFDRWSQSRHQPFADGWRLALVFSCALIHGLGLAGVLDNLGLDSTNRLLSLVGFNAGIELAQLGVALLVGLVLVGIRQIRGAALPAFASRVATYSIIGTGAVWLAQRSL